MSHTQKKKVDRHSIRKHGCVPYKVILNKIYPLNNYLYFWEFKLKKETMASYSGGRD
jgi:hypothetical protein